MKHSVIFVKICTSHDPATIELVGIPSQYIIDTLKQLQIKVCTKTRSEVI